MCIDILKSKKENQIARAELCRRGIDCCSPFFLRLARKLGLIRGMNIGDSCKSWDILRTLQFVGDNVSVNSPILDIGAYASEVLCALFKMGYRNLSGIDLNPNIGQMPYADKINYVKGDFMNLPFKDNSFSAITAISVIEHGFEIQGLLRELSRVLKTGGYFIASVDYWPEKIKTDDIKVFGMEWMIFSKDELYNFFEQAKKYNFMPTGPLNFSAPSRIIKWSGKQYTFAWLSIQKH